MLPKEEGANDSSPKPELKQPQEFIPGLRPAETWKKWRSRYERYRNALCYENKTPKEQKDLLLYVIGDDGYDIYVNFKFTKEELAALNDITILDKFDSYYKPYASEIYASYKFGSAIQKPEQSLDEYVLELQKLVKDCGYGTNADRHIRDKIVLGVRDDGLRERLLRDHKLTLESAIQMCRAAEVSKSQVKDIKEEPAAVDAVRRKTGKQFNKFKPSQDKSSGGKNYQQGDRNCSKCSTKHAFRNCPAYGKECHNCKRKNHFSKCCFMPKKIYTVEEGNADEGPLDINCIKIMGNGKCGQKSGWYSVVEVESRNVSFKLDTGADVNVLPRSIFKTFKTKPELLPVKWQLQTFTGSVIAVVGRCILNCKTKGIVQKIEFYVAKKKVEAVLSADTCEKLNLVKRIVEIKKSADASKMSSDTSKKIIQEYEDVFTGAGRLPGVYKLKLKDDAVPFVARARPVPSALEKRVKAQINKMEREGIIVKVDKPTDWVSPIVVTEKANGKIRICLDPRQLNKAVLREHHPMPRFEQMLGNVRGKNKFTVLDARDGFWHIELDEESSYLCTFITQWGRYRFLVLPFGLNVAPEIFQKAMEEVYKNEETVNPYYDDVLVAGVGDKDHDRQLEVALKLARENNLKFNKDKLQVGVDKVAYLGHELSGKGLEIDPKKVESIIAMKPPENKAELQRFLGMVTYLAKFVENLSQHTPGLRNLLKKETAWVWDSNSDRDYNVLKTLITNAPVLSHFNSEKPIVILTDASSYGIGSVLMQEEHPVEYGSVSLTPAQQNYAQIEKELLAVMYSCEHFRYYVYGRKFKIVTDHKPLLGLMLKPYDTMSPKIQRMMLKLQTYDFELEFIPGKKHFAADTLSRAPRKEADFQLPEMEVNNPRVHLVVRITDEKLLKVAAATENDKVLRKVCEQVKMGWPHTTKGLDVAVSQYFRYRNELYCENGLLCRGSRLVIP